MTTPKNTAPNSTSDGRPTFLVGPFRLVAQIEDFAELNGQTLFTVYTRPEFDRDPVNHHATAVYESLTLADLQQLRTDLNRMFS